MNKIIVSYNNIPEYLKRSLLRFFLSFLGAWLITVVFNDFPKFSILIQKSNIDFHLQNTIVWLTESILNILGFETWSQGKFLRIAGYPGVRFEYSCLGIRHMMFFAFFIILYFGKALHKLWYIPLGLTLLIIVNSIRGAIISIAQYINTDSTMLVHDISTPILMYSSILLLWIIWINKHLKTKRKEN